MPRPKREKQSHRFKTEFTEEMFLNVLTEKPQTTSQIREQLQCSNYTVVNTLKRMYKDGKIEMDEIKAASRTGKMYLWKKKE